MATARKTITAAKVPAKKAVARKALARKAAAPQAAPAKARKKKEDKPRKPKLVRDSFTIPKTEYAGLDALKARAAKAKLPSKKSEVLRAGVIALAAMDDAAFARAMSAVPTLKTGRPKKD